MPQANRAGCALNSTGVRCSLLLNIPGISPGLFWVLSPLGRAGLGPASFSSVGSGQQSVLVARGQGIHPSEEAQYELCRCISLLPQSYSSPVQELVEKTRDYFGGDDFL